MTHDFVERLNFSEGVVTDPALLQHLVNSIPGAIDIVKATEDEDRNGTDVWVARRHGLPALSVDFKHRSYCPIERWGSDDVCIETCSVFVDGKRQRVGWTIDETKRTDLVAYTWPAPLGRRFWVLYFPTLCAAAQRSWQDWAGQYGEKPALNEGYTTLCIYVPRTRVAAAMRKLVSGEVGK